MILVAIPYHKEKRYAINHILDWTEQQTHKDIEVIIKFHLGQYGEPGIIKEQFNHFRDMTLAGNYSHLFIMEADTIPPLDAIDKLLQADKDIISLLYYYRDDSGNPVAWEIESSDYIIKATGGTGTGGLLINSRVLKDNDWNYDQQDADWPFMNQLKDKGITPYIHTEVIAKHYKDKENYS